MPQLKPFRCHNEPCKDKQGGKLFHAETPAEGYPECPDCGESSKVTRLSVIHLLILDPNGSFESMGHKYRWGCDDAESMDKAGNRAKAFTGEPTACTCAKCLESITNVKVEEPPE